MKILIFMCLIIGSVSENGGLHEESDVNDGSEDATPPHPTIVAAQQSAHPEGFPKKRKHLGGRFQARKINTDIPGEIAYRFAFAKHMYGSEATIKEILEFYHQESTCKKREIKAMKNMKSCAYTPNSKIIICEIVTAWDDLAPCKITGDKYTIPINDRRSLDFAMTAVMEYNKKNANTDNKYLHIAVTVTAPMDREVLKSGTKNYVHFSTPEVICNPASAQNADETCFITTPRVDCEAVVTEFIVDPSSQSNVLTKHEAQVNCQANQDPNAAESMVLYDKPWEVCKAYRTSDEKRAIAPECYRPWAIAANPGQGQGVTTMSADAEKPHEEPDVGFIQEAELNKRGLSQNLFIFLYRLTYYGDNLDKKRVMEIFYKESECKVVDADKLINGSTATCKSFLPGKFGVCQYKSDVNDLSFCKFSGEKYDLGQNDRRNFHICVNAIFGHNMKLRRNLTSYIELDQSGLQVLSPLHREVTIRGTKNVVRFATRELHVIEKPNPNPKEPIPVLESTVTKARVDCEAQVQIVDPINPAVDVKCTESKETLPKRTRSEELTMMMNYRRKGKFASMTHILKDQAKTPTTSTTMSADDSVIGKPQPGYKPLSNNNKMKDYRAKVIEDHLNNQFAKEFLFKYVSTHRSANFLNETKEKKEFKFGVQLIYQETSCKKGDVKDTEACQFNPNGKIALCDDPDNTCKFTGDKFEIDPSHILNQMREDSAATKYNNKYYPKGSILRLVGVALESPVQIELGTNIKETFKFRAKLQDCSHSKPPVNKCDTTKDGLQCEATITTTIDASSPKKLKSEDDIKCPGLQVAPMAADFVPTKKVDPPQEEQDQEDPQEDQEAKDIENELNAKFAKDFLFKYVRRHQSVSLTSPDKNATKETKAAQFIYQETNCKKGDSQNIETCKYNPNGKVALCTDPGKTCKFTGDKYEIPVDNILNNMRTLMTADDYNEEFYPEKDPKAGGLRLEGLDLLTPVQIEIGNEIKETFKFSAKLKNCSYNGQKHRQFNCSTVKDGIQCDAKITSLVDALNKIYVEPEKDIRCPNLQATTMSGDSPEYKLDKQYVKQIENKLNSEFAKESMFRYVDAISVRQIIISDLKTANHSSFAELVYRETTCKKGQTTEAETCQFNPNGKIAVCNYPDQECRFTGESFPMATTTEYANMRMKTAAYLYSEKNYPRTASGNDSTVLILWHVALETPVKREISLFVKDEFKFTAKLENLTINVITKSINSVTLKNEVHCEAVLTTKIDHEFKVKTEGNINCPDLQVTPMAADSVTTKKVATPPAVQEAKNMENELNAKFAKDFLFKYFSRHRSVVLSSKDKNETKEARAAQLIYKETNCKKGNSQNIETCQYNPNGKVALCNNPGKTCKFTGDKYEIPVDNILNNMRTLMTADDYNEKHYPKKDPKEGGLSLEGLDLLTPVQIEIGNEIKETFKFSAKLQNCSYDAQKKTFNCSTVKDGIQCEATTTTLVDELSPKKKQENDIICPDLQVTTMAPGMNGFDKKYDDELNKKLAKQIENELNNKHAQEYLFRYVECSFLMKLRSVKKGEIAELVYQETNCKKGQATDVETCEFNLNGKIAVCSHPVTVCRLTGESFSMPSSDEYARMRMRFAAYDYTHKNYPKYSKSDLEGLFLKGVSVESPVKREISSFVKDEFKFLAKLENRSLIQDTSSVEVDILKNGIHCEAVITTKIVNSSSSSVIEVKTKADVKCPELDKVGTMSADPVAQPTNSTPKIMAADDYNVKGKLLEKDVNALFAKDFLFKFIRTPAFSIKVNVGKREETFLNIYRESTCTKSEAKDVDSCQFNPKGKIAVCVYSDVMRCKFTGDKYVLKGDEDLINLRPSTAVGIFNAASYAINSGLALRSPNMESSLLREVTEDGIKDTFKFTAEEVKCPLAELEKSFGYSAACTVVKPKVACTATVTTEVPLTGAITDDGVVRCPGASVTDLNANKRSATGKKRRRPQTKIG